MERREDLLRRSRLVWIESIMFWNENGAMVVLFCLWCDVCSLFVIRYSLSDSIARVLWEQAWLATPAWQAPDDLNSFKRAPAIILFARHGMSKVRMVYVGSPCMQSESGPDSASRVIQIKVWHASPRRHATGLLTASRPNNGLGKPFSPCCFLPSSLHLLLHIVPQVLLNASLFLPSLFSPLSGSLWTLKRSMQLFVIIPGLELTSASTLTTKRLISPLVYVMPTSSSAMPACQGWQL